MNKELEQSGQQDQPIESDEQKSWKEKSSAESSHESTEARTMLWRVGNNLINLTPEKIDKLVKNPSVAVKNKKILKEDPSLKTDLIKLKQKALAHEFEDGFIWVAKKFQQANKPDSKYANDEKSKAKNTAQGIQYLQTMITEWQDLANNPKLTDDKKRIMPDLISKSKRLILEKKSQSVFVDSTRLDEILTNFTASTDKDTARQNLKGFISDCELRKKDKTINPMQKRKIISLQNDAQGYLMGI